MDLLVKNSRSSQILKHSIFTLYWISCISQKWNYLVLWYLKKGILFWLDQIFNKTTVLNIKVLHNNVKVFHKTWLNFLEKENQNQNSGKHPSLWNTITAIRLISEQDALQDCNQILRPNDFSWRNRLLQRTIIVPWGLTEGKGK